MEDQSKQQNSQSDTAEFQVIDKRKFLNLDNINKESLPPEKRRFPSYVEELMARMAETERKFQEKKKQIDEEINRTKARLETDFERNLELEIKKIILPFLEVLACHSCRTMPISRPATCSLPPDSAARSRPATRWPS